MRKVIFATLMLIGLVALNFDANAQNNSTKKIEAQARKAADEAGCLDSRFPKLSFETTISGGCACAPAVTGAAYEVKIFGTQNGPNAGSPVHLSTVVICGCTGDILSIGCLIR